MLGSGNSCAFGMSRAASTDATGSACRPCVHTTDPAAPTTMPAASAAAMKVDLMTGLLDRLPYISLHVDGSIFVYTITPFVIYHGVIMALNLKNAEVERLAAEVARLTGESKTEAIRRALDERRRRLKGIDQRRARVVRLLE